MSTFTKIVAGAAAGALVAAAAIVAGAPQVLAATGPPQPYHEPSGGIGFPYFAIAAVAVIAGIAIWQGIKDAEKKKQAQEEKNRELEEVREFEEYFGGTSEEPETAASSVEEPGGEAPEPAPAGEPDGR
jgi:uncharacterized transporter YbjL